MFSKFIWRYPTKHANPSSQPQIKHDGDVSVSSETNESSDETTAFLHGASDRSLQPSASSTFRFFRRRHHSTQKQQHEQTYDRRLDPQGLTIISNPSCSPSADIIFVHGLGGSSRLTWAKNRHPGLFWPQKWLPLEEDIQSARIWSFGYDAQFLSQQKKGVLSISDFAKDLLFQMKYPPDGIGKACPLGECPIIFVAHSMGGLVFKKAFLYGQNDDLYKPIIASIRAVVFLSTPHRGTDFADYLNKILRASMIYSSQQYISELVRNSPFIEEINEQFRHVAPSLQIFSFYETRKTEIGGRGVMILRKDTSVLGYTGEISKPLNADHHEVCKFDSTEDINYKSVCAVLRQIVCTSFDEEIETAPENAQQENKIISSYLAASHSVAEHDLGFFWSRRSSDTCTWIIETETYKEWVESPSRPAVMWLHAQPGRGKSILSSYMIHRLLEQGAAVQYYFFRFSDQTKQSIGSLLKSLSIQLSRRFPTFRRALIRLKNSGFSPHDLNGQSIWQEVFVSLLFKLKLTTPIYWIIDGIDESESPEMLVNMLHSINSSSTPIRVLLVSRYSTRLSVSFKKLSSNIKSFVLCADELPTGFYSDIYSYTAGELSYLPWSEELQEEVVQKVTDNANGSFLWVHFVVEEFKDCDTMDHVTAVLNDLPKGMETLYKRMELSISNNKRGSDVKLQRTLFIWALYSREAVTTGEMIQALKPQWPLFDLTFTINRLCGHFIVIEGDNCIRLIHETARDYLMSKSTLPFSLESHQAHYDIFNKCVLAFTDSDSRSKFDPGEEQSMFLYRATSWVYHLNNASVTKHSELCLSLISKFFNGRAVFFWIHVLSSLENFRSLINSSNHLRIWIDGVSATLVGKTIPQEHNSAILEMIRGWTRDLLKVVAKFGIHLLQKPAAIYECVPSLCPPDSYIFGAFKNVYQSSLRVHGVPEGWDDCIARVSWSNEHAAINLTCSRKYVAVVNSAGTISLWDTQTFRLTHELSHEEYVQTICFSRSGELIASYGSETTKVWNPHSGELVLSASNAVELDILELAFSKDETRLLAASDNRGIFVMPMLQDAKNWEALGGNLVLSGCHKMSGMYSNCPTALAFNFDHTKVAATFRRYPLILWSVGQQKSLKRLERSGRNQRSSLALTDCVTNAQWHPNNEEILGIFADGRIFKWDINSNAQRELKSSGFASDIRCSPDGRVFATSDPTGRINFYDYKTFSWIYQLPSEGTVIDLCFSHDSKRFYDIRGNHCNVWEPDVLTRSSNMDDHLSDSESQMESVAQSNVQPKAFANTIAPITALCPASKGTIVCTGNDDGLVEMHDYLTHSTKVLGKSPVEMAIRNLSWSSNCARFAYSEMVGKVNLLSIQVPKKDTGSTLWDHTILTRFKPDSEIGGIKQVLLNENGRLLLVAFNRTCQLWSTQNVVQLPTADGGTSHGRMWVEHPVHRDEVLSITPTTVIAYKWENISELRRWAIVPAFSQESKSLMGSDDLSEHENSNTIRADIEEEVSYIRVSRSKTYLLLTMSRRAASGNLRPRHAVIYFSTMENTGPDTGTIHEVPMPDEIATQIERPLDVFESGHLVFVDRSFWLCSCRIDPTIGISMSNITRHFFLPRDWVTIETVNLLHLTHNGTLLCPRKGELAVIESSLKSEMLKEET